MFSGAELDFIGFGYFAMCVVGFFACPSHLHCKEEQVVSALAVSAVWTENTGLRFASWVILDQETLLSIQRGSRAVGGNKNRFSQRQE